MPKINLDNPNPSRFQKLQVSSMGHIKIGKYKIPGWKDPIDFYLFLCKKHGYVTRHVKGHDRRLECPKCFKEATK